MKLMSIKTEYILIIMKKEARKPKKRKSPTKKPKVEEKQDEQ